MDCIKIPKTKNLFRIFNVLPYNQPIDVYLDGTLVASNLKYKDFTSFSYGDFFKQKIDVFKAGTTKNPIIKSIIKLPAEQIFTVAITGNKGEEIAIPIEEDVTTKPSNESAINRIVNLSPELPEVDVTFNGNPSANNIEYRDETLYAFLPPGEYDIVVEDSETSESVVEGKFSFKTDRIYSIYIIGDIQNIELLQSVDGNTYVCRE